VIVLKRRLIFTLLWRDGRFCLSRNFKLQSAGDLDWIKRHYNLQVIAFSIDELVVLNVTRGEKNHRRFADDTRELSRGCFVPLAAGGGVRSIEDARLLLSAGADKIVLNTPLFDQPELVKELAGMFGTQCVVGSIDYRKRNGIPEVATENGSRMITLPLTDVLARVESLGAGEVLLTNIDRDGTGQGYDLSTLDQASAALSIPVIASGGVGRNEHFQEWLERDHGFAAATANIFNFLGEGLVEARRHLAAHGVPLASWDFTWKG